MCAKFKGMAEPVTGAAAKFFSMVKMWQGLKLENTDG
jgi:hypothetical protein